MQRELMAAMMILPFVAMIGIIIGIFVFSGRKGRRVKATIAARIATEWHGTITEVRADRDSQWWQESARHSAPRLLLEVSYRDSQGSTGRFFVARVEKSGEDDPHWCTRRNCPDVVYYGANLPGPVPSYTEVEERWKPGASIEKVSGEFYPRLN